MKRNAIYCLLAFAGGILAEHVRVKSTDTLWGVCYYWQAKEEKK